MSVPKATRPPAGDKGTADRIEADDGAYWVRLVTRQALDREGAAMGHCVGDGGYDELVGGEEIYDDSIWSLRRADGVSVLTVRVQEHEVDYARGPRNLEPGRGASLQLLHLVAAYTARSFQQLLIDEDTGITLLPDGRTFRIDRLPPDVAAAREASQASRRALQESRRVRALERDFDRIVMHERVEICTNERPGQPIIRTVLTTRSIPDPDQLTHAMFLTTLEPDPVEGWRASFDTDLITYRTRAGIRFEVPPPDIMLSPAQAEPAFREAFLTRYRAAVGQTPVPAAVHSAPAAVTEREARRAVLLGIISPEAERRRHLQDEAYDRDIARILGRAAGSPGAAIWSPRIPAAGTGS